MNTTFFVVFGVLLGLVLLSLVGVIFFLLRKRDIDASQNKEVKELREAITNMQIQLMEHLATQLNSMRGSLENSSTLVNKEARLFTQSITEMREVLKQVHTSVKDVSSFQEIFKSPKLRGSWGEASLEHLLAQYYPRELYELQYMFSSGERADAVFKLPDGKLVAIDSKFPVDNFSKMVEAQTDFEKEQAEKNFIADVKARIDEIATKYILPSEETVDYAIMYVPAEAIYYEMVNPGTKSTREDVVSYGLRKRVVITSPNLFYLTFRTIEHWSKDVQFSKQTREIIKRFEQVRKDAEKLSASFSKLGKHLSNAQSSYEDSSKRLEFITDRVDRLIKGNNEEKMVGGSE